MKIGLSTNTLQSATGKAQLDGIGVYTAMLLQGLNAAGQEVLPISDKPLSCGDNATLLPKQQFFSWPFALSGPANTFLNLPTPGQKRIGQLIDLYHCTDYFQPLLRKIPVVTTLHDAIFLQNPEWCRHRLRWFKNYVIRNCARRAQRVICVSHIAKQDVMAHFGISEEKISVIHHGVDEYWTEVVSPEHSQELLKQFHLKPNYLLFVGTIQPRKNVLRLLQAYKMLPADVRAEYQLLIVGKPGWDEEAIKLLQKMQATGEVNCLGYVTKSQLRCLMQASKLFVFPSLYEGFGLPVLEAFASGTAVITANSSALPEISGDAALLINPFDVEALSAAIQSVLLDANLRNTLIARGRERVGLFSWQRCVEDTIKVYQSILE